LSTFCYEDLILHVGHKIVITTYEDINVAIECETCNEVLLDFDKKTIRRTKK